MNGATMKQETLSEGFKAVPAIGGAAYYSMTLSNWVAIATITYIVIQTIILLHKHYYFVKEKNALKK